jgi:threonine dehydratase
MKPDYESVQAAAERIGPFINHTPVMTSEHLDDLAGCSLFFKCENLQKAGAFKSRGAVNAIMQLGVSALAKGVATHSSGNHGAALARAAGLKNTPAYIVVPDNAKQVKQDAIRSYGGQVILCEPTLEAREAKLEKVLEETGATFVHPYDQEEIIAGQGTAMLELVQQVSGLDVVIVPVGGGGLLAGSSLVAEHEQITIIGAEPEGADDAYRSVETGDLVLRHTPKTLCDGLLTTLGARNFGIIREKVDSILLVTDQEIIEAMLLVWTRMKLIIEPSSAVTLAVVLRNPDLFEGRRVGLVLTGGNVDLTDLPFLRVT